MNLRTKDGAQTKLETLTITQEDFDAWTRVEKHIDKLAESVKKSGGSFRNSNTYDRKKAAANIIRAELGLEIVESKNENTSNPNARRRLRYGGIGSGR